MQISAEKTGYQKTSILGLYIFALSIPISFVPAEFAIALIFIGWLLEGIIYKNWQFQKSVLFIPLAIYLAWNIVSSLSSPRPLHSLWAVADNEWPMFIMFFMVNIIDDSQIVKRMAHLWLLTGSAAAVYGIWQTFNGKVFFRTNIPAAIEHYYRAEGFSGFYLTFAGFMMTVVLVALCLATQAGWKYRWRYALAALLSFGAVLGTFARSIWLSFAVAVPVFGISKGKKIGGRIAAAFIVIVVLTLVFVPAIRDRAFSIIDPSQNQTRLNLWQTTLHMSHDHLVLGIGEDNFDYYFEAYKVPGFYDATGHPHNDYLNELVSSGIPGIVLFLSLWVIVLRTGFATARRSEDPFLKELALGGSLAIIGFLVGSFFQDYYGTFANCWGWWFMAGLVMTSHRLSAKASPH